MSPEEKLKKGEVQDLPWITGITSKEGVNIVLGNYFLSKIAYLKKNLLNN